MNRELGRLYKDIKAKKIDLSVAHELNNTVANMQGNIRLALLNAKLGKGAPSMEFFKTTRKAAVKKKGGV